MKWLESVRDVKRVACVAFSPDKKLCTYTFVYNGQPSHHYNNDNNSSDSEEDDDAATNNINSKKGMISLPFETAFPGAALVSTLVDCPAHGKVRVRVTTVAESQTYVIGGATTPAMATGADQCEDVVIGVNETHTTELDTSGAIIHVLTFGSASELPAVCIYDREEVRANTLNAYCRRLLTRLLLLAVLVVLLAVAVYVRLEKRHTITLNAFWYYVNAAVNPTVLEDSGSTIQFPRFINAAGKPTAG